MRVIGIDSSGKRDLVVGSGAEVFIDHLQEKEDEAVKAATDGLGAQAVLVLTAANSAYARCMSMLRFGGSWCVWACPMARSSRSKPHILNKWCALPRN